MNQQVHARLDQLKKEAHEAITIYAEKQVDYYKLCQEQNVFDREDLTHAGIEEYVHSKNEWVRIVKGECLKAKFQYELETPIQPKTVAGAIRKLELAIFHKRTPDLSSWNTDFLEELKAKLAYGVNLPIGVMICVDGRELDGYEAAKALEFVETALKKQRGVK